MNMRKTICLVVFASLLLFGCNGKSSKKEAKLKAAKEAVQIEKLDSISNLIDNAKTNIENSTNKVDSLLKEL